MNEIRVTWSAPSNGEDALTEFCISIDATAYYTGSTATSVTVSAADLGLMDPLPSCETYTVTVTPRAVIPGLIEGSAGSGSLITGQGSECACSCVYTVIQIVCMLACICKSLYMEFIIIIHI